MGPRAGLDDVDKRKFLILPGLELRILCRPANRYTDYAIPAYNLKYYISKYYLRMWTGFNWLGIESTVFQA
jgi:hypothetical protein